MTPSLTHIPRPRLCRVCRLSSHPCYGCRVEFGIHPAWAAYYLGLVGWPNQMPTNKKDREFIINAAIKSVKDHYNSRKLHLSGDSLWWQKVAKQELMGV